MKNANNKAFYKYLTSELNKTVRTIQELAKTNDTIENAAKTANIDVDIFTNIINMYYDKFSALTSDEQSLFTLYQNGEISKQFYNNLKSDFASINEFSKLNSKEYCKTMREHHISLVTLSTFITVLCNHDIHFMDCATNDDMYHLQTLIDAIG